jgi:hypothetical protein
MRHRTPPVDRATDPAQIRTDRSAQHGDEHPDDTRISVAVNYAHETCPERLTRERSSAPSCGGFSCRAEDHATTLDGSAREGCLSFRRAAEPARFDTRQSRARSKPPPMSRGRRARHAEHAA